mgnify:FL=1
MINIFPTPINIGECEDFADKKDELMNWAYKLKYAHNSVCYSNRLDSWQSPPLEPDNMFNTYSGDLQRLVDEYKITGDMTIKYIWVNVNSTSGYNTLHHHGVITPLSGVFYIKVPENSGDIVFHRPTHLCGSTFYRNISDEFHGENKTMPEYRITPKEGMIVLFPSYLWHLVEPNTSGGDRISISFNISMV